MEEQFGPFRLEARIGRGGMGEVYRARDTRQDDRSVALKRLPIELASDGVFKARFRREARLVAGLTNPNVVPIYDYGDIGGQLYLAMALIEGIDLATLLRRHGSLTTVRATSIVAQVARALDGAHHQGVVHRDVKPSNILLVTSYGSKGTSDTIDRGRDEKDRPELSRDEPEDFAYLIDFGIARAGDRTPVTADGVTIGTASYMAPEQFSDPMGIDERVDVYALGCVLYEALCGVPPFGHGDFMSLGYAHVHESPPRVSAQRPDLPVELDRVVNRALAKDRDRRYPQAGALARAARAALATSIEGFAGPTYSSRRNVEFPLSEPISSTPDHPTIKPPTARHSSSAAPVGGRATQFESLAPAASADRADPNVVTGAPSVRAIEFARRVGQRLWTRVANKWPSNVGSSDMSDTRSAPTKVLTPYDMVKEGDEARKRNDNSTAVRWYERAIASGHNPEAPRAMIKLGNLLSRDDDIAGAQYWYEQAIAYGLGDEAAEAAVSLGVLCYQKEEYGRARGWFEKARDSGVSRQIARSTVCLGAMLHRQGELSDAKAAYEQAASSGHAEYAPRAMVGLGVLLLDQGEFGGARATLDLAIASGHADYSPIAMLNMGRLLTEQGDVAGARSVYAKLVQTEHKEWAPAAATRLAELSG